jgi:hypothetical protein
MRTLLIFDKGFPIAKESVIDFLNENCKYLEFVVGKDVTIATDILTKPKSFNDLIKQVEKPSEIFDRVFCFTEKKYSDNYFFHEHKLLSIISSYGWTYLTDLPITNGLIYFIIDYFALVIDKSGFRHNKTTGCIYDFLWSKDGIDDGMRQAKFCPYCLKRITKSVSTNEQKLILEDLKNLMNLLSNSSKWNLDVIEDKSQLANRIIKRKSKHKGEINIVIASPGDTQSERTLLLDKLETQFRRGNHEKHCGKRLIVHGWEDLASQPGYPQDIINKKIINEMDFVIAFFRHKLGTPTINIKSGKVRAKSGSVEELLQAIDNTKKNAPIGMAYFYSKAPNISLDTPDFEAIRENWQKLDAFKKSIQNKVIYKPYIEVDNLLTTIVQDLEKNIIDYFK